MIQNTFLLTIFSLLVLVSTAIGQSATIEGYVYETNNRGYLNLAKVTVTDKKTNSVVNKAITDQEGFFSVPVPLNGDYTVKAEKDVFETKMIEASTKGIQANAKVYVKLPMQREPGYLFDVTMAEKWDGKSEVDAIQGALVEIYNNTTEKEELVLKDHPDPYFKFTFEKGNHYTVMIRKEGYFTKRMEAYVDVDGCILCFDGLDDVSPSAPGASDNLTAGHQMGTIISNVELVPIRMNEGIALKNIYYDVAKWDIRPDAAAELDKLIVTLQSNPSLVVELGSHTDSRGSDAANMSLSQKRAESAVNYIIDKTGMSRSSITARGYGETKLVNKCKDGVECSNRQHQKNRRTELKIIGIQSDPMEGRSLAQIIKAERFDEMLAEIQNQEVVEFKAGDEIPEEIRQQIEGTSSTTSTDVASTPPPTQQQAPVYTPPTPSVQKETTPVVSEPIVQQTVPPKATPSEPKETMTQNTKTNTSPSVRPTQKVGVSAAEYEVSTQNITRPPKRLPDNYSGFKIEFFTSRAELPLSHNIFVKHGNITLEQRKDGLYSYSLGNFPNKNSAENFLRDVMNRQYPGSRVIKYSNGRRLTQ